MARVIPKQWIDVSTGQLTLEAVKYLNDLESGSDNSIGTLLSGINRTEAKADGIIAGTQVLATVNTADAGNLPSILSAQGVSIANVSAGTGFTVALNRYSVTNNAPLTGAGSVTTLSVTGTAFGGSGTYTDYDWTYVSGATFTVNSPTSATTTFTKTLADAEVANAVYRLTVTDDLAATASVDVAVNAYSTPLA